ncbi:hypothetical protein MKW92_008362 [Papaver armeniacum]|nr:hypothetical protein MKW92_008362 [Papaver armeniacum]
MSLMMSTNSSPTSSSSLLILEKPPTKTSSSLKFIDFFCRVYDEHYPSGFLKKLIATFLLVFVTCGSAALTGGLIVMVMIYAVCHVSGAHMNPAVTCAFAAVRHFPWKQVPFYAAAQLTGALVASFTLLILLQPIKNIGTTSPCATDFQALVMEIVVTFSMMFVTAAVATDTKAVGELAGIVIGFCGLHHFYISRHRHKIIDIILLLIRPVSGGSMNPVRTIGPAIASKHYKGIWVYIVGPLFGTLTGAWSYNLIRGPDKPVHTIAPSPESSSFRIRRFLSNYDEQADVIPKKDPLQII